MKDSKQTNEGRRDFAFKSILGLGGLAIAANATAATPKTTNSNLTLPEGKRMLGSLEVSAVA